LLPLTKERAVHQTAYQVQAASSEEFLQANTPDLWDSGITSASTTGNCIYQGILPPVGSRIYWRVKVWTNGNPSEWSEIFFWENGLLRPSDWTGPWIGMNENLRKQGGAYLRGSLLVNKPVVSAVAYICGLGWCELYINGNRIGNGVMDPAQSDYELRCFYIPLNITEALKKTNSQQVEIGVILGDGWYNQWLAWGHNLLNYGSPRLKAQFIFNHPDGTQTSLPADLNWKANTGPIIQNNVYRGEVYDATKEILEWGMNPYESWSQVIEVSPPGNATALIPQTIPSEEIIRELTPISIKRVTEADNERPYMYDFGENMTGWCRLKIKAAPGTNIRIEFAEKINPDGTLFRTSVGNEVNGTVQVDYYKAKGGKEEIWEPRFTFHGFQHAALYIESGNLLDQPDLTTLTGIVVHTNLKTTGTFECSDPQLNRIHQAALRTILAGMHGLPMDCPVRERCGWTGDAHAITKTMLLNYDAFGFLHKFFLDMETNGRDESNEPRVGPYNNSSIQETKPANVPHMIAPGKRRCGAASPDWGAAIVFIPWQLYKLSGDKRILDESYHLMENWINYLLGIRNEKGIMDTGLGDWCAPSMRLSAENGQVWIGNTEIPITSTFMFIHCCRIMTEIETIYENRTRADYYKNLADDLTQKIMVEYFQNKDLLQRSQTAISMALLYGGNFIQDKQVLLSSLIGKTRKGERFDTGVFGTPVLLEALRTEGYANIARKLLTKAEYPSYRSMLDMGANTFWEYWPTAGFNGGYDSYDGSMSHPMHSSFDEWLYAGVAGFCGKNTSDNKWHFSWNYDEEIKWAKATNITLNGEFKSEWSRTNENVSWTIVIPSGEKGVVTIPADANKISESEKSLVDWYEETPQWLENIEKEEKNNTPVSVLSIGSGTYTFNFSIQDDLVISLNKIDHNNNILDEKIYSMTGICLGNTLQNLSPGLYLKRIYYENGKCLSTKIIK
jgi:alpha-L-rhamnosidase